MRGVPLDLASRVTLNDGRTMPVLGLGTAGMNGGACRRAVRIALDLGVRLIDTASAYGNEREVGEALKASGVAREDVFLTTKVWTTEQGYESTLRACEASLRRLGTDYVDLDLIHWPVRGKRQDTWRALARLREEGACRSIGVSNYMVPHLDELRGSHPIVPAVNQIELSPFLVPSDVLDVCRQRGIAVEAYSPLTRGRRLNDPKIARLAERYGRTPAQVLIRWSLQRGFIVIPKAARPEHVRENANVFDVSLAESDMKALDALNEGRHFDWDPTGVT